MSGVFQVARSIFDHDVFAREPFNEQLAWIWLLSEARWKPERTRVGRKLVTIERGQLCHSERFLATKWMWSKSKVHRFLLLLKSEAMVTLNSDQETNLITICNYGKYNFDGTAKRTSSGPQSGPVLDQFWTKEEEGKKERLSLTPKETKTERKKQKHEIPPDWQASQQSIQAAQKLGFSVLEVQHEAVKFKNYAQMQGREYVQWDRAFDNWCIKALEILGKTQRGPPAQRREAW